MTQTCQKKPHLNWKFFLISEIGVRSNNTGPLTNLTAGGDGGDTITLNPRKDQIYETCKATRIKNGKVSWTDGVIQIYSKESPGDSFYRGYPDYRRDHQKQSGLLGALASSKKVWVNNGVHNIFVLPTEIPEGYSKGRLNSFNNARGNAKGKCHYHDGVRSYMLLPTDPRTEHLIKGRLPRSR